LSTEVDEGACTADVDAVLVGSLELQLVLGYLLKIS
jgi:hypothetical protein